MPDDTMASAAPRTTASFTLQPNLFHEFQPMGGVMARPFGLVAGALTAGTADNRMARRKRIRDFMVMPLLNIASVAEMRRTSIRTATIGMRSRAKTGIMASQIAKAPDMTVTTTLANPVDR